MTVTVEAGTIEVVTTTVLELLRASGGIGTTSVVFGEMPGTSGRSIEGGSTGNIVEVTVTVIWGDTAGAVGAVITGAGVEVNVGEAKIKAETLERIFA